jgi:hypothetical protein
MNSHTHSAHGTTLTHVHILDGWPGKRLSRCIGARSRKFISLSRAEQNHYSCNQIIFQLWTRAANARDGKMRNNLCAVRGRWLGLVGLRRTRRARAFRVNLRRPTDAKFTSLLHLPNWNREWKYAKFGITYAYFGYWLQVKEKPWKLQFFYCHVCSTVL